MYRGHGAVVAGVHRLKHVQGFRTAHLADDDAIRPHAQAVPEQGPLGDFAAAFDVRRARFQTDDVLSLELQLRGVFDRDHAFMRRNPL